jgi:GR25 family glycosyltransferase involved in LPS biosynthesis
MINLKTYIVHCKKFNERKLFLQDQIANLFSNYEFYEEYDGDELTESIIQSYYCSSVEEQIKKLKLWYEQKQGTPYARILNKAEISLTIKHYEVLKKIAESSDEYAIVLEDDVIFISNFVDLFFKYLDNTPKDFDFIFLGSGANLKPENISPDKIVYLKNHPASKCTDSYVVTRKAANDIIKTYLPFNICVDYELAYQMYLHNHKVYWWEPSLIKQGSEVGLFKSSLR